MGDFDTTRRGKIGEQTRKIVAGREAIANEKDAESVAGNLYVSLLRRSLARSMRVDADAPFVRRVAAHQIERNLSPRRYRISNRGCVVFSFKGLSDQAVVAVQAGGAQFNHDIGGL